MRWGQRKKVALRADGLNHILGNLFGVEMGLDCQAEEATLGEVVMGRFGFVSLEKILVEALFWGAPCSVA